MKERRKWSPIWRMDRDKLVEIVQRSDSISDILREFGLRAAGGNHKALQHRLQADEISIEHFTRAAQFKTRGKMLVSEEDLFCENSSRARNTLVRWIKNKNLLPYVCVICGLCPEWNNRPLTLRIDHINGVFNDNRLENLRWVCPNCDSQLDTFCSRNRKKQFTEEWQCTSSPDMGTAACETP